MSRLAVIFPGIGYTAERSLLYYSRKLAERAGYETKILSFSGFPKKVRGDREWLLRSCELACAQAEKALSGTDLSAYDDVLFIGKSIGTVAAASVTSSCGAAGHIRFILFTPLEETFSYPLGDALVFTGSADPWTGGEKNRIPELCAGRGIPCFVACGANHSLETADPLKDIATLQEITSRTESFIREPQIRRITYNESLLDRLQSAVSDHSASAGTLSALRASADALAEYYGSEDWKRDFADDEAGFLPSGLKRGVLSEDGIYNTLETYRELADSLPRNIQ